jgi:hypothetical protein
VKETWLAELLKGSFKAKPPAYWVRQQNAEGRVGPAPYAIWHKNYDVARQYVIWDQAPEEDWLERGYLHE